MRRRRKSIDRALRWLAAAEASERNEALSDLGYPPFDWQRARPAQRQLDQVFHRLVALVRRDPDAWIRERAAHLLACFHELRGVAVLLGVFTDVAQTPAVRGQAAEGVGGLACIEPNRGRALRAAVIAALRAGLRDPVVDVRFWCLFSLAVLRVHEARPEIEALVDDDAVCPQMWRVGDEARDTLDSLDGKPTPDRVPGAG